MIKESLKYQKRLTKKLDAFSGRYMSDSKWTKLFRTLSKHNEVIKKCFIKNVGDNVLREINIPPIHEYPEVFNEKGINDIMTGGPSTFKEIEWVEFPSKWTINRPMGKLMLEPFTHHQDILEINSKVAGIGELELELTLEKLIIYGYK